MLLFIRGGIKKREWLSGVSIHLILLFISTASSANRRAASFNTSHVTLYLRGSWRMWREDGSFNTSHVTLYQQLQEVYDDMDERFNTSHVTLYLLINYLKEFWNYGFNTSHVTLYLSNHAGPKSSIALFQYISCYSLSWSFSSPFGSSQVMSR